MKRKVYLLLAAALAVLLLCACSQREKTPQLTVAEEATAAPSPSPTPSPEPTPRPLLPVDIVSYNMDESLFVPIEEQGSIFMTEYETMDYVRGGTEPIKKKMGVYLPYGYDVNKKYDVVFLMHVSGADENFWLMDSFSYASHDHGYIEITVPILLDNMIARGYCEPVIVMAPDGFPDNDSRALHNSGLAYDQFSREFAEDIMPFVAEYYATYAEGTSKEELIAAREHFAFLGASFGAYMNYLSVMSDNFDLVSNYAVVGGGEISYDYLMGDWTARGTQDYKMSCLYIGEGEYDDRAAPENSYYSLLQTEKFDEGNLHFTLFERTGHEDRAWINTLFNSLQLFFRE